MQNGCWGRVVWTEHIHCEKRGLGNSHSFVRNQDSPFMVDWVGGGEVEDPKDRR